MRVDIKEDEVIISLTPKEAADIAEDYKSAENFSDELQASLDAEKGLDALDDDDDEDEDLDDDDEDLPLGAVDEDDED